MNGGVSAPPTLMKIQKNIAWIRPFLLSVKTLVPLNKINRINGYSVPPGKSENAYASITRVSTRKCNINIKLTSNENQKPIFLAALLENLAHEMAHLVVWEHTHKHFALQARILTRFSKVLKKAGIKNTYARIKI